MNSAPAPRLVLLDGLRGLAALMVVLFHANLDGSAPAFSRGYLMVDLFFMLSGFVLTLNFERRFTEGLTAKHFTSMRFRRFQALVMISVLLAVVNARTEYPPIILIGIAVASCLMLPQSFGEPMYQLNAAQWSLLNELIANFVHARWLYRLSARHLALLAIACALPLVAAIALHGDADLGASVSTFLPGLLRTFWAYIIGIVMARHWRRQVSVPRVDWRVALLAPAISLLLLPHVPLPDWLGDAVIVVFVLPGLFWLCCNSTPPPRPAAQWLSAMGWLSFPLYAVHLATLEFWDRHIFPGIGRASGVPFAILVAIAAGLLANRIARAGRKFAQGEALTPA